MKSFNFVLYEGKRFFKQPENLLYANTSDGYTDSFMLKIASLKLD